jgi:zinc transport system substrate-binding protein
MKWMASSAVPVFWKMRLEMRNRTMRTTLIKAFVILVVISGFQVFEAGANEKMPVFVSIPPQKYFVQQIGKDLVDVQVMVQPGADPHTYAPKPKQMAAITRARIYFAIGVEFEAARLEKIVAVNPQIDVVYTDHGIQKIPMSPPMHPDQDEHLDHNKNPEAGGQPKLGRPDPHIWLSPPLVVLQAQAILKALQNADPAHRLQYEANYSAFVSDVMRLDAYIRDIFAERQGFQFMVFHPSWGYFAHTYGLKQVPIESEGKAPKPAQLKALIMYARARNIKVLFVQPQFSAKSAELIAKEIDGQVVFADPLALDWSRNLRDVAAKFKAALR